MMVFPIIRKNTIYHLSRISRNKINDDCILLFLNDVSLLELFLFLHHCEQSTTTEHLFLIHLIENIWHHIYFNGTLFVMQSLEVFLFMIFSELLIQQIQKIPSGRFLILRLNFDDALSSSHESYLSQFLLFGIYLDVFVHYDGNYG